MIITGVIVEYNPFHNGHIYHLQKAKELTNCDLLVAVVSGNFNQRGDISIINKYQKTSIALEYGVDIVVELPFIYTVQNAYVFASKAIEILKLFKINYLVFGSETNNLDELKQYAEYNINVTHLKEIMDTGVSFPKAYGLLAGSLYPNDILAVAYLKALKDSNITPISIARTSNFHSDELKEISSASAIRKALKNNIPYNIATPLNINKPIFNDDFYKQIQLSIIAKQTKIKDIFLVDEGIENLLIKNIVLYNSYDEFVSSCVSKRYTRSRIQRIILMILLDVTKLEVSNLEDETYAYILGFNEKSKTFLKELKNPHIFTLFKKIPPNHKDLQWKVDSVFALLENNDQLLNIIKKPIIK